MKLAKQFDEKGYGSSRSPVLKSELLDVIKTLSLTNEVESFIILPYREWSGDSLTHKDLYAVLTKSQPRG